MTTALTIAGLELLPDTLGNSEAYYCRNAGSVLIDEKVIAALKERLEQTGGDLIRICLHDSAEERLHDMVIVQRRGRRFKPHKHLTKDESYHMLEGSLRIDFYDDSGAKTGSALIGGPGTGLPPLLRVRAGVWHSTDPESAFVAVHEARCGPFIGNDSIPAIW